jgi:hypothetical protein
MVLEVADGLAKQLEQSGGAVYLSAVDIAKSFLRREDAVYELTNGVHGDIEHLYTIEVDDRAVHVGHAARPTDWYERHKGFFSPHRWETMRWYTPAEFAQVVNDDRQRINANYDERHKNNGSHHPRYPTLDVEGKPIGGNGQACAASALRLSDEWENT